MIHLKETDAKQEEKPFLLLSEPDGAVCNFTHNLSNFRETFFIVFSPPNVTVNECTVRLSQLCQKKRKWSSLFKTTFCCCCCCFLPLWRRPTLLLQALTLWQVKPANLSRDLKIFSCCLHLVILPAHLILKVMRADFLIGYCISGQTHTHELMK